MMLPNKWFVLCYTLPYVMKLFIELLCIGGQQNFMHWKLVKCNNWGITLGWFPVSEIYEKHRFKITVALHHNILPTRHIKRTSMTHCQTSWLPENQFTVGAMQSHTTEQTTTKYCIWLLKHNCDCLLYTSRCV